MIDGVRQELEFIWAISITMFDGLAMTCIVPKGLEYCLMTQKMENKVITKFARPGMVHYVLYDDLTLTGSMSPAKLMTCAVVQLEHLC